MFRVFSEPSQLKVGSCEDRRDAEDDHHPPLFPEEGRADVVFFHRRGVPSVSDEVSDTELRRHRENCHVQPFQKAAAERQDGVRSSSLCEKIDNKPLADNNVIVVADGQLNLFASLEAEKIGEENADYVSEQPKMEVRAYAQVEEHPDEDVRGRRCNASAEDREDVLFGLVLVANF